MKFTTRCAAWRWAVSLLLTGLLGAFGACSYTRVSPATPTCSSLPATVSYRADVLPVLRANCYRCHSAANYTASTLGKYNMEDFSQVQFWANPANGRNGISYMVGTIERRTDLGFLVMPYDGAPISACDVAIIRAWVQAGAPNN